VSRNQAEQRLLNELEIARERHEQALFYLHQTIEFVDLAAVKSKAAETAAFHTAFRKLQDAGEVYDMALLELTAYLRARGLHIPSASSETFV